MATKKQTQPRDVAARDVAASAVQCEIAVPLAEYPEGVYLTKHVDVQLDEPQARQLRRLIEGLDVAGERLASGRRITTGPDAVRWLLEQFA